jgi:hypothetical protein
MVVCGVIFSNPPMQLEAVLKQYLDQAEIVKTLNKDVKDVTDTNPLFPEIQKATKQLQELKAKLNNVPEVAAAKEKRDTERERLGLLKDILMAQMTEAKKTEVEMDGKKVMMIPTMKIVKQ